MKNHFHIKLYLLYVTIAISSCFSLSAQDGSAEEYLKNAGSYAGIFNGKIETSYNPKQYDKLPYYHSPDFSEGELTYKKTVYPRLKMRLDLSKDVLTLLTPKNNYIIFVEPSCIQQVKLHGKTFIWKNPQKEDEITKGFYILLLSNDSIQLLCREKFQITRKDDQSIFKNDIRYYTTKTKQNYIFYRNHYYPVKNKDSFVKIFPQFKKEIHAFVKNQQLKFKQSMDEDMKELTNYCIHLLSSDTT